MSKIYHFTKLSTAIEHILPNMSLRTNFLNNMNGPKENQKWSFGGVNIDYENIYSDNYNASTHITHSYKLGEEIKSKIQALCFVHSDDYDGFENEMMWAQYSDDHKGICLEIDTEKFLEENEQKDIFKFQNINYNLNKRVSLYWDKKRSKEENINQIIKRDYEPLFLSKSHYWEKEYEKRLLMISDDYCELTIFESLTGIYYGLTANQRYEKAVEHFVQRPRTEVYEVYFEDNRIKRMKKYRGL